MIKLSNLADYAVLLLALMAKDVRQWASSELSERAGVPMPTTSKLLKVLAQANLLKAQRGASGGYSLVLPPDQITLAQIIECIDGPIALTHCVHTSELPCIARAHCPTSKGWGKINGAVRNALQTVSLADLVE